MFFKTQSKSFVDGREDYSAQDLRIKMKKKIESPYRPWEPFTALPKKSGTVAALLNNQSGQVPISGGEPMVSFLSSKALVAGGFATLPPGSQEVASVSRCTDTLTSRPGVHLSDKAAAVVAAANAATNSDKNHLASAQAAMKFAENASKPPVGLSASLLESSVFEDLCDYGIGCPSLENRAYDSLLHPSRISSSSSFLPHSSVGRKLALRAQITAASLKEPTTSKMIATVASLNDKIVTKDSAEAWVSWLPGKSPTILQGISSGREGDRFGTDAVFEEQKDYFTS